MDHNKEIIFKQKKGRRSSSRDSSAANSLAAELFLDENLPPFFRLKNYFLIVVYVLREPLSLIVGEAELQIPKFESEFFSTKKKSKKI